MENDVHFHSMPSWAAMPRNLPFTYPFAYAPDKFCREAASQTRDEIARHATLAEELEDGKMLGVLTCENRNGEVGFLASFSGTMRSVQETLWFVPPVLDYSDEDGVFKREEAAISEIGRTIESRMRDGIGHHAAALREMEAAHSAELRKWRDAMTANRAARRLEREEHPERADELNLRSQHEKAEFKRLRNRLANEEETLRRHIGAHEAATQELRTERRRRSNILQRWLFSRMRLHCADGRRVSVWDIFQAAGRGIPPSGAGECAAPKLLNYAFANGMTPISMAEFWIGKSPKGEIRIAGQFYPACQTKCRPLLERMLRGVDVARNPLRQSLADDGGVRIIAEDEWLLVADKPAGLMTVSDDESQDTLMRRIMAVRPGIDAHGYTHRLDMATSGIVVIAKDKATHKAMQQLFATRQVSKTYVAMVEGVPEAKNGTIRLPLIPNIDDRPRQMVDFVRGKEAISHYEVIETSGDRSRLLMHPTTGRTHQLRIHAAHPLGLGCPIVGDNLYGTMSRRLLLHSAKIEFVHPQTGATVCYESPAEF